MRAMFFCVGTALLGFACSVTANLGGIPDAGEVGGTSASAIANGGGTVESSSSTSTSISSSAPPPLCGDLAKNGDETDTDCGGRTCAPCGDGQACLVNEDCKSGVCTAHQCQAATCDDHVTNGSETDVDCGGSSCTPCADGQRCSTGPDCLSTLCTSGTCRLATCGDQVKDGSETDVDCGGSSCAPCALDQACTSSSDCESEACVNHVCVIHSATAIAWEPTPADLTAQVSAIALGYGSGISSINGDWSGVALVGFDNGELYKTVNGKSAVPTWTRTGQSTNSPGGQPWLPNHRILSIAISPIDPQNAWVGYMSMHDSTVLAHTATLETWQELTAPLPEIWGISVSVTGRVYLTAGVRVSQSSDSGVTWENSQQLAGDPLAAPLSANDKVSATAIIGHDPNHIIVGTFLGNLFESVNATSSTPTWRPIGAYAMPARVVTHVTADPDLTHGINVYVTFAGQSYDSVWCMSRTSGAETWRIIGKSPLPVLLEPVNYSFTGVSVNPADPSALYLPGVGNYGLANGHVSSKAILWKWTQK